MQWMVWHSFPFHSVGKVNVFDPNKMIMHNPYNFVSLGQTFVADIYVHYLSISASISINRCWLMFDILLYLLLIVFSENSQHTSSRRLHTFIIRFRDIGKITLREICKCLG